MALFIMIVRKMVKNKWLELCLIMGLILSVALVSSIPIYTDAVLQRLLYKDLANKQLESQKYSGLHRSTVFLDRAASANEKSAKIEDSDQHMESMKSTYDLPILYDVKERSTMRYEFIPVDSERLDPGISRTASISAMSGLQENVQLVDGRLPAKEPVDGVYEALVFAAVLPQLSIVLNHELKIHHQDIEGDIVIKPVGIIRFKDHHELYFYHQHPTHYNNIFFVDFDLFEQQFLVEHKVPLQTASWYMAMDYTQITIDTALSFVQNSRQTELFLARNYDFYNIESPILDIINPYLDREQRLRTIMWSLNVPVMIMLAFYLFMVSNLMISRQKTEIAVIRSRGASRFQIMMSYAFEGLLLGLIAFIVGPYLGMLLTKVLGASNGFLEFVQRSALQVNMNATVYQYAFIAVVCSIVMTLIPAFIATKATIIGHKQQKARVQKQTFWHKYFLDVIFIVISGYGLMMFHQRLADLQQMGMDAIHFRVDPLLFLIPALFILGMGLFVLRIYPWAVRLLYWAGRIWWTPSLYSTLIQVGRSSTQYQFIMVFLTITMATGLFSASAARTLNQNMEEQIWYHNGSDIVLSTRWENDYRPPYPGMEVEEPSQGPKRIQYTEPPFVNLTTLPGVESATKVFKKEGVAFDSGITKGTVTLMGIETKPFGQTSWMADDLLPYHFYEYLNLIAKESSAVLISRTMAEQKGIQIGDVIHLTWDGLPSNPFMVYGMVDYFPSFNPNPQLNNQSQAVAPMLVVGHLGYIQNKFTLEPYEVWIKLHQEASVQVFYDALQEQRIPIVNITDTRGEIIAAKNDPFQLAINGVLTLGFLISILISFFGFLLYWILSLLSRVLQLGIFRAMGISFRQLLGMLVVEQILTSGAALLIGIVIGQAASRLFVPLFQMSFSSARVPPFQVILDAGDSMQLFMIVFLMITLGLVILGYMVKRIKIHQAVKLGED